MNRVCFYALVLVMFYFVTSVLSDRASSCPYLPLKNGRVRSRQRGRFLKFVCNTGYTLVGERISICAGGKWDMPPPKCVRTTCPALKDPPSNGLMYPSHGGGVLNFYCKSGFELRGPSAVFCDGLKWDNNTPTCLPINTKPKLFCDFEDADICNWSHDLNHDFEWIRDNFKTPSGYSIKTGPSYDHTKGEGKNGHYMYIESSSRRENDTARLISPVFDKTQNNTCLEFFYHMYGSTTGTLRAYVKKVSKQWPLRPQDAIFTKSGNQGDVWYRSFHNLGVIDEDFQIIMEGVRGPGYVSDIAIDDVRIIENCVYEEHVFSTTEGLSTVSEILKAIESCENRCGQNATGNEGYTIVSCDCDDNCYENNRCCPDYVDFCFISTSTSEYESTEEIFTERIIIPDNSTVKNLTTATNKATQYKITLKPPFSPEIRYAPSKKPISPPKINTLRPLIILRQPTTSEIIEKILPKPAKPIKNVTSSKITFLKPKTPGYDVNSNDVIDVPQKQDGGDVELLPTSPLPEEEDLSVLEKEDYIEKMTNEKEFAYPANLGQSKIGFSQKQMEYSSVQLVLEVVSICCAIAVLVIVTAIFLVKYKVVKFRNRRINSGNGDSQSDVRFLTADEVLDFSLDKDYDDL